MISKRKFCIKNILKQNVKCKNPKVTWIVPESDCLTTPCEGCNDECIEISLLEGCDINCIKVIVECPDCDDCPPIVDEVCFCTGDDECDKCDHCDEGICKPKCEEYCDDNGNCVECVPGTCEDGRECIDGKCICPPSKVEVDGICYDCMEDSHCGPCEVCVGGKCVARDCYNGVCDPSTGECIGCIKSGDCGPNEQCVDGECVCAPGFTYKPGEGCVPSPECETDNDCGDCFICSEEGCVERKCPEGTICHEDECVPLCDCDNPICTGANRRCTEIKPNTCACIEGDPNTCNNKPCNNGEECGEGCGCIDNECVPCKNLDCNSNECADTLGCECQGQNCIDSGTRCRGNCSNGSDCGPGCGCLNGKCVPCSSFNCDDCEGTQGCGCNAGKCEDLNEECLDHFTINKSDSRCALEARLITANKCQCNRISISTEVDQNTSNGTSFKIQLRDGDASTEGLMNIPLLRDTNIANYSPSTGRVNVKVIERGVGSGFGSTIYDQDYSISGTDEITTDFLPIVPRSGITGIDVIFTIPKRSLKFDSGCSFSEEEEKITYKLNSVGRNGFIKYEDLDSSNVKFKVLESADSRTPIFTWFATSQGAEDQVRSVYARRESEGVYVDGWNSISEGIRPGMYYRVESDCACEKDTFLTCPNSTTSQLLTYCNPKDITDRLVYTLSNCYKTIDLKEIHNIFPVCEANSRILQPYELYLNGQKKGAFLAMNMQVSIAGTFSLNEAIETIEIRLAGNNCEDCYEPIRITGTSIEVNNISYDCNSKTLGYSISGGSGEYRVYADGDPTKEPNNLPKGEHTITFEDVGSGCKEERSIQVDCCASFEVNAANTEFCTGENTTIDLSIFNGEAPYDIIITKEGTEIDSFITNDTIVSRELPSQITGNIVVEAEDSMGCISSDIFKVIEVEGPSVSVSNTTYCSGDSEIDVVVSIGKTSEVTIFNGGVVEFSETKSGTFTVTLDIKSSKTYQIVAESGGCQSESEFTIQELPCPDPIVNTSDKEICQNEPIIVTAQAISGTPPYSWVVEKDNQVLASGEGGEINYETGIISNEGDLEFDIKFTDHHGKTGIGKQTITILPSNEQRCIACPEVPNTQISGGTGRTVDVGQNVMLTHTNGGTTYLSYSWIKDGVVVGTQKSYFFNATFQDIGTSTYTLKYEYAPNCFAETNPHVVTVTEENCECDVTMKVLTGVENLNGKTVTPSNSTNPGKVCALGNQEIALQAQIGNNCGTSNEYTIKWTLKRRKQLFGGVYEVSTVATGFDETFKYTPVQSDSGTTLIFELEIRNGNCVTTATGFSAPVSLCAGNKPFNVNISELDSTCITEANTVPIKFHVQAEQGDTFSFSWKILRGTTSLANGYETGSWSGLTKTISKNINLSPYTGLNNIKVEVRRSDTMLTVTDDKDIEIYPPSSIECTSCSSRNIQISLTGAPNDQVDIIAGQYTNVVANATSSLPSTFTYQWKRGGTVVSNSKTLSVNPTTNTNYTVTATDEQGCTKSKTINVRVQEACTDPSPMDFTITYDGYTGGPFVACPGTEISIVPIYDSTALPPTLFVNGSGVTIPPNNIVKVPMSTTPMVIKLEGRKREECPAKSITKNISVEIACGCTLPSFGIEGKSSLCPNEEATYTVTPNGDDSGYTYTWYDDANYTSEIGTGKVLTDFSLVSSSSETLFVEAVKNGCNSIRRSKTITRAGCNVTAGTVFDKHIYHPSTEEIELTTFRFNISAQCEVSSINKLIATYSGGITFDLTNNATISTDTFGNYLVEGIFPPNTRIPKCTTSGSDPVEGVDATFNLVGGGSCDLVRNFGKVCSETPGLNCNTCQ